MKRRYDSCRDRKKDRAGVDKLQSGYALLPLVHASPEEYFCQCQVLRSVTLVLTKVLPMF